MTKWILENSIQIFSLFIMFSSRRQEGDNYNYNYIKRWHSVMPREHMHPTWQSAARKQHILEFLYSCSISRFEYPLT